MTERAIRIAGCRSCGSGELEGFLNLGQMPLSDGLRDEADLGHADARFPLEVAFCGSCGLVQILHTVPPEVLFADDYPYFSSFTDAIVSHAKLNVDARLTERRLDAHDLVIEIASNDGYLLQHYRARGVRVLGVDPARGPVLAARARGVPTRHAFFTHSLALDLAEAGDRASVIHANNVLAHVSDTNGFVAGIAALLRPDGVAVIEVPYVRDLIDHNEFDTIYHEHLCYFSVTALVPLFERHGLSLNRVERVPIHGGSLRLFVEPREAVERSVEALLEQERELGMDRLQYYAGFSRRVEALRTELKDLLAALLREGKRIAGYGAAAKGAILLNHAGVGTETLAWVADKNVHKQGRYMPGVHVPIVPPARILEDTPDYLLILPWNFRDEIMQQQREFAARGGRFIVPVPKPEVV
ncbi:MAG: class I SAM-dependent methyltransferase [Planctomycetota bacterium]